MFHSTVILLFLVSSAIAQGLKPGNPEPAADRRKTLDQLTATVHSSLPTGSAVTATRKNYIDDYIFGKAEGDKIPLAGLCSDSEFLRRISLDLTGRLPEPEAIRKFVNDSDPDKRERLIDSLVATSVTGLADGSAHRSSIAGLIGLAIYSAATTDI